MTNARIFFESFMDGFTMSGFMSRLERPGRRPLLAEDEPEGISELLLAEKVHDLPVQELEHVVRILSEELVIRRSGGVSFASTEH